MNNLDNISNIGPAYQFLLNEIGIKSVEDLLEKGANPKGRKEIEEKTGINQDRILYWFRAAQLSNIRGLDEDHIELLLFCNITASDLQLCNVNKIYNICSEVNNKEHIVEILFTLDELTSIITDNN